MLVKGIIFEDFVNYKKPSMTIAMPYCSFKCDKECGYPVCQNSKLANDPNIDISIDKIIDQYIDNPITHSVVFQGLEPFDSWDDLERFIYRFRMSYACIDDIVIYTGYNENEIEDKVKLLSCFTNIIIKFGRFVPNQDSHYDEILGVKLASDNQYAKKIN